METDTMAPLTFDEWYKEVLAIVKAHHPIYLIGGPDPDHPPEEPTPLTDEQVARWDEENRMYFEKYYKDGETPHSAILFNRMRRFMPRAIEPDRMNAAMKEIVLSQTTAVKNCFVKRFCKHFDNRGSFEEIYNGDVPLVVKQVNISVSKKNVLRGLHVTPFAKFVRCIQGTIYDVVADVRPNSESFLKWHGQLLTEENELSIFVPPNCGHGFVALEDSIVCYMQDGTYDPSVESSVRYDDELLNILWPVNLNKVILSDKDGAAPFLR